MSTRSIKYIAYCRKSSESEDKQVASIEDQKRELLAYAEREGLSITGFYEESQSAHTKGRPVFANVMNKLENGEAQGLLVWHLNRLARNPRDCGWVIGAMDDGDLVEIRTPSRSYLNRSDDKFMIQLELGMAKKDSDDKGVAVKRAYKGKLEKGWRPGCAPVGYRNIGDVGNKTIIIDEERFNHVRKMWDLFLTGTYAVSKIRDIATDEWGLRTRVTKRQGGKPLSMSQLYYMFNEPFYYGYFEWKNPETGKVELYKGSHQPMITEQEFSRAQVLLGKKGKPQPKTKEFYGTGLMRCGECDSAVTAEEKQQVICSECKYKFSSVTKKFCPKCETDISEMQNPTLLNYIYYHCTKKKNKKCTQKSIRIEELEAQFNQALDNLNIDDEYLTLALDYLQSKQGVEVDDEKDITKTLQQTFNDCQTRLQRLSFEFTSPQNNHYAIYTPDEFSTYKKALIKEREGIEQQLEESKNKVDRTLELSERTFTFCAYAKHHFAEGDIQKKRNIFSTIGSNIVLRNQKISIEALEPYLVIEKELSDQKKLYGKFEPNNSGSNKRKTSTFNAGIPTWLRDQDSNLEPSP